MDFQIGEKVIHWNYGLGEIVQMDKKTIHGRQTSCYVVRVRDLMIWVPADEPGRTRLRLPTPGKEFERIFSIFHTPGEPLPEDRVERQTHLLGQMKDGKLSSICQVVRDLTSYRRARKLNDNEKSILEHAMNFLIAEWMFSLSVSMDYAQEELTKLLGG